MVEYLVCHKEEEIAVGAYTKIMTQEKTDTNHQSEGQKKKAKSIEMPRSEHIKQLKAEMKDQIR